ncbi:hypothetical protein LPJ73_001112 [Coemansia sp. RSA 2703]|nr:hypothetical protein LPJ73_001112 [Coemansia sp. RSA 2703]KAJ2375486.1 hypothetical protein IW150_002523 [Coemansia sp. RSA 2607]KAJ2397083.1 hypothetical protein GGI05_000820 [Coemansia sp. RSA 2603]
MNNGGRKSQYLQLDGSQSGSAANMDTSAGNQDPLSPGSGAAFTRGVGFEDQYTMASAAAAGADSGARRNTMFGTLKEAMGVRQSAIEPLDLRAKGRQSMGGTGGDGNVEKGTHEHVEDVEITRSRRLWVAFTWLTTFWLPSPVLSVVGRMKRPDVRMAWREKFAICVIIVFMWALLLFIIIGLGLILCPRQYVWTQDDISNLNTAKKSYMSVRGNVYDITDFMKQNTHGDAFNRARSDQLAMYAGNDVNASFPITARAACPGLVSADHDPNYLIQFPVRGASENLDPFSPPFVHQPSSDPRSSILQDRNFYYNTFLKDMDNFKKGGVVWKMDWVESMYKDYTLFWRVINKEVFNLQPYMDAINWQGNTNNTYNILDTRLENIINQSGYGTADITEDWLGINWDSKTRDLNYECMKSLFYVGKVDSRQSVRCLFTNYMLVAFAGVLMLVVLVKFLTALQFTKKPRPSPPDKFVVCQVPCYTEDEESISKTINSLAALEYADKQKLIFIICDGNIVGSGNDKSTPRLVLDILGVDPEYDPPGRDYLAIAEGSRRHNIGKVYSGLYEFEGHVVPFMVVAKVGSPEETNRSGNRGKRDTQILLMSFFNKVHFNLPMTPLELEIYHQMRHIIGVPPRNYEYLLQVDADTEVMPDSLARLVSACTSDRRIAGICGETMLGNESTSWTTMMQVYEYFISHHMAKAFESLFGSVTCLPGCFCMYRLRSTEGKPLLIAKPVLEAYSELHIDTLHKKNLLSLGEDRYLTTLMMKHFPNFKLKFIQDAKCKTIAPEKWSVLVSQRRRWINSTIHNLSELLFLPNMCGFCFFSMRFVVFLDLFGTITMPTTLMYFGYLIYIAVSKVADVGYISLILIGAIYGLQAIIFLLRREWQHIGWMLIYLCAYPLWSFVLPIYSFWHMDDFSWGNTRVVVGDGKRKIFVADDKPFDPESIPQRRWMEYEKELASAGVLNAPPPNMNPNAGSTKEDDRLSLYSSQSGAPLDRVGSAMAFGNMAGGGSHQSMYGTPVMPAAGGAYDPRLSVAMANPQAIALQQQQYQQQTLSMYDNQTGRMSAAGSAMGDPRLSSVMYTPQQQQQQMFAMQSFNGSNQSSPHGSGIGLHNMAQQQQLGGYMNPDAWNPPTTTSVYGSVNMPMQQQQQMSMYMQPNSPNQMQLQMQQQPFSPSSGGSVHLGSANPIPSDDQIVDSIRRILVNADLTTTTKKVIRNQLALEYGTDLSSKKDFISKVVDQMLIGGTQ